MVAMPKTKVFHPARHARGRPSRPGSLASCHAFLSQEIASTFQTLGIGATLRDETGWYAIHAPPNIIVSFEHAHGLAAERYTYNDASVETVRQRRKVLLTQHAGFHDFFVPVGPDDNGEAILVTGPFAVRRPTSTEVLERWRWITGRQGHPADPEFAHYLSATLSTLSLPGDLAQTYRRFLQCYALLIAHRGDAHAVAREATKLKAKLEAARAPEQMWSAARSMTDERTASSWLSSHTDADFPRLGIERIPESVLVGIAVTGLRDLDPVDELLRRDAFQRECVALARSEQLICGRVGDHGVMFLFARERSADRIDKSQRALANEVSRLAKRRFGLRLHFGANRPGGSALLPVRYEQALGAAERALARGLWFMRADSSSSTRPAPVRELRVGLGARSGEPFQTLVPRFERYIEAVAEHCGYRFEAIRAHLEAGFDQAAEALLATGTLAEKGHLATCEALDQAAKSSFTLTELFDAYRRAIADLVALVQDPGRATQERSLSRAITFIHQHFTQRLSLTQVARVAGFAPGYFSQLFKRREKMTLDRYVRQLRIERAKQLLKGTDLSAERVGQLAGFTLRPYFYRVFGEATGMTPLQFRAHMSDASRRARFEPRAG
jgi:AraC-like DNA-binding protein